ncbi:polysaccharide deacetylase family protein [Streptomyces sp. CB01881]|uniref:polysaccharide deacetylase family protein n=1 Tax=Streptomyces sp. CB01881 TaxID=2078691 RepID=UPI000CDC3A60|nr:polysaccharide deacetylase family protein [Streptomyces sp. CB01881]AUY52831.1 polysaccharide deacetylase [Streptomyces sp. CB01881]TYC70550.1 polysaccharide deacetylase [Streptomyces sp. CB01881]
MSLSRRTLLIAAAGSALAGCQPAAGPAGRVTAAAPAAGPLPSTAPEPESPTGPEAATTPAATPATAPGTVSGPPSTSATLAGRADVLARYAGVEPSEWGLDVTGVLTSLPAGEQATALTFDACGGPGGSGYDADLIEFLRTHEVPATLFLNARWIDANPAEFESLAGDPLFEIANHGTLHRPLSVTGRSAYGIAGTGDAGEAYDEVAGNLAKLTALLGRPPRFFRSGTAHYDDVATRIAADLDQRVAGFTVNADAGATFTSAQVREEVAATPPGAVVIAHLNHPGGGTAPGFAAALPPLLAAGRRFTRLSDVLG